MGTRAASILIEWFGELNQHGLAPAEKQARWWLKDPAFDEYLRSEYAGDVQTALLGGLDEWLNDPHSTLALIILLDQFTRNIYRDKAEMYFGDARALRAADSLLLSGDDLRLPAHHRAFCYMPLMHAESHNRQQQSLTQFKKLAESATPETQSALSGYYDFAEQHAAIVRRFGRFPHRNWILERTSTGEEVDFLQEPGSSF